MNAGTIPPAALEWPEIDPDKVDPETAAFVLAQAEAALKAQLEGIDKQLVRLGTLMTPCISLGSATIPIATAVGVFSQSLAANLLWVAPLLVGAAALWFYGAIRAASSLRGAVVTSPGRRPMEFYDPVILAAKKTGLVLLMIRITGQAIAENEQEVKRLALDIRAVFRSLCFAPVLGGGLAALTYAFGPGLAGTISAMFR